MLVPALGGYLFLARFNATRDLIRRENRNVRNLPRRLFRETSSTVEPVSAIRLLRVPHVERLAAQPLRAHHPLRAHQEFGRRRELALDLPRSDSSSLTSIIGIASLLVSVAAAHCGLCPAPPDVPGERLVPDHQRALVP